MGEAVVMEAAPTFEEYVAARGHALWRSAWLLTGDAQQAEDLAQTALVKCWRRWDQIAVDGTVDGYIRRALTRPTPTGAVASGSARFRLQLSQTTGLRMLTWPCDRTFSPRWRSCRAGNGR